MDVKASCEELYDASVDVIFCIFSLVKNISFVTSFHDLTAPEAIAEATSPIHAQISLTVLALPLLSL
jgi:hypothetical protein